MPRTSRASRADSCYHVLNRGNARAEVLHKDDDYAAFFELMGLASRRIAMWVLGYCPMPIPPPSLREGLEKRPGFERLILTIPRLTPVYNSPLSFPVAATLDWATFRAR